MDHRYSKVPTGVDIEEDNRRRQQGCRTLSLNAESGDAEDRATGSIRVQWVQTKITPPLATEEGGGGGIPLTVSRRPYIGAAEYEINKIDDMDLVLLSMNPKEENDDVNGY
ncbi:hypothetical protein L1987_68846 [Smallanthus sonchifolius]|uniref:Uncharacterized protein n=1 Tax=Smallanthus sonchifolius TaxID=185202 RepID=A0ACB9B4M1_9ASTR|nr:hypothetical protein L1987_68846 [Smallanthus sonchifolius]